MPTRSSPAGTQFENKVRGSLSRIGFRDVDGGPQFIVAGMQIDAVGGWDDVLLVIEATQTGQTNASIRDRIFELRGKSGDIRRGFRSLDAYRAYQRYEFALVTQGFEFSESDIALADSQPKIHLIDFQIFEYYQGLVSTIGSQAALFNLLGELEVEPRDLAVHRTPAFKADLGDNRFGYLFFCEPQKLLEIAYVARRETGRTHYYQRLVTSKRLSNIRDFINHGGVFPNNIVLAFETSPQFRSHTIPTSTVPSWLEFGELTFPKSYRAAWIIDGQHRLYAFGGSQSVSRLQKLPVFAFDNMPTSRQAGFFIEINREQKPVSPDLIWDIEADLRPDSDRGRIALAVKQLNEVGPLMGKIYFPLSGSNPQGKVKISSICNDLSELRLLEEQTKSMTQTQRNPLTNRVRLEERPARVARGVSDFIGALVQDEGAEPYRDTVILRAGGITLALNIYEQVLISLGTRPQRQHLLEYSMAFVLALDQLVGGRSAASSFVKNQLTSYAQRREVVTQVVNAMRSLLVDQDFGQAIERETPLSRRVTSVERKLAELVASALEINSPHELRQRAPQGVWEAVERRSRREQDQPLHALLSLGEIKQIVDRQDNRTRIQARLTGGTNGFRNWSEIVVALDGLTDLRNPHQHGRSSVQNRPLGLAFLSAFERNLGL